MYDLILSNLVLLGWICWGVCCKKRWASSFSKGWERDLDALSGVGAPVYAGLCFGGAADEEEMTVQLAGLGATAKVPFELDLITQLWYVHGVPKC